MLNLVKRLTPGSCKRAYHRTLVGWRLLRDLDTSSPAAFSASFSLSLRCLWAWGPSLIAPVWLKALYGLVEYVERARIPGDIVECGVYRGGSAAILAHALQRHHTPRQLWLFDSFSGLPAPSAVDGPGAPDLTGKLSADVASVRQLLRRTGVALDAVHIVPGWFHETFPSAALHQIALLHIDADWYASIKLCLETFYDRLSPGGVVVLDDYLDWPGCKTALDEFLRARSLTVKLCGGNDAPVHFFKPV